MRKCKILELIGGSLTDGGAETLVKDYLVNIDNTRFETALFVDWTVEGTANTTILKEYGQKIFTAYPEYSLFWRGIDRYFRTFFVVRGIRKAIRIFNPDVIHVHLAALHYLTFLTDEIKGRKLFYTCHSTVNAKLEAFPEEDKAARLLVDGYGMKLIALHDSMKQELDERYKTDSIVVNNGIDIERFRSVNETKDEIRQSLGIPSDSFVVGHVGRFVPVKNHQFLLRAFEEIHKKNPNSFLLLIGDGVGLDSFKETVRKKNLSDSVIILSHRTDIPRLLKAIDVFMFPSLYEGLGIALIEAQIAGVRCVASDTVPAEAFISNLVIPLNLSDSPYIWSETALDSSARGPYENRLSDYDIKSSVRKLENLYLEEK